MIVALQYLPETDGNARIEVQKSAFVCHIFLHMSIQALFCIHCNIIISLKLSLLIYYNLLITCTSVASTYYLV